MLTLDEISVIENKGFSENNPDLLTQAVLVLEERYQANPNESKTILRLGHLYWYLIAKDGIYKSHLDYQMMRESLRKLYEHAKVILTDNVEFLWSFAYMIGISFYNFETEVSDYTEIENLKLNMYNHALEIEPSNPFPILAGWGDGFFRDLEPSIMKEHCKNGIIKIHYDRVLKNRGHFGIYFEDGLLANIESYLGFTAGGLWVERDAYVKKIIDEATKTSE